MADGTERCRSPRSTTHSEITSLPRIYCLILCFLSFVVLSQAYLSSTDVEKEFHNYELIHPVISSSSSRHKRSLHQSSNIYPQSIALQYRTSNKSFTIDLKLNVDLFAEKYYQRHHDAGVAVSYNPKFGDLNHCYYQGKIKGIENSWAALSTCNNHISGVVDDGEETHYIEPMKVNDTYTSHYLVKESSLKLRSFKCGYSGNNSSSFHSTLLRERRAAEVRPPSSSNRYSRYVELVLVNDKIEFEKFDKNEEVLFSRSKQIGNIVNALYAPLNIYIALVGVVVWSDHDEITLSPDGDTTLTKFLEYRRERLVHERANDNAQLITGLIFKDGVVGKALKGTICTHEYSGGVNMDHSKVVGLVATTVAHELGHNFGMEHDETRCECPASKCIMAPSSSSTRPSHWSSCSLEYLHFAYKQGMDYCLHNKPDSLIGPVCGNGFLEEGEQCDCGLKEHCNNYCCNPETCRLYSNASCATGMCCDLKTCQVKPIAVTCREAISECDLPEYCDGESEFCPNDVFIEDGNSCKDKQAYCVKGQCKTHVDQCRILWGPTGMISDRHCFNQNMKGNKNGNCGFDMLRKTFSACHKDDVMCGMLHCTHRNEKLEFGMESASKIVQAFIRIGNGKVLTCRSALVDLGVGVINPGLTPDGAICGPDKMCYGKKCVPVSDVKKNCPFDCYDNGVCNSNGNCHCVQGFGPPLCDSAGPGGSIDSGPASDPAAMYRFMVVMLVLFLGVVPMLLIIAGVAYVFRRDLKGWWMGKARRAAVKTRPIKEVKPNSRPTSKFGIDRSSIRKLEISSPLPINGSVVPVASAPTQSMLDGNSVRNMEISNPILQSHSNKHIPVRPAPPKPNGVLPSAAHDVSEVKPLNKSNVSRASSLNRKESARRSRSINGVPARPSAPPPRPPPPPSYWEVTKSNNHGAKVGNSSKNSTERSEKKEELDKANSVIQNKMQKNSVASLAQKFENSSAANDRNNSNRLPRTNLSNKHNGNLNQKC